MDFKGLSAAMAFGAVVSTSLVAAEVPAAAAPVPDLQGTPTACRTSDALSDAQMEGIVGAGEPNHAICFVAGICSTVWPWGTLLCGPSALVCVHYLWNY
jgi:hypothetical protein